MFSKSLKKNHTFKQASKRFTKMQKQFKPFWSKHQLKVVASIAIIFVLTVIASSLTKATPEEQVPEKTYRRVTALDLNERSNSGKVSATIKNASAITLVAQTAGPISFVGVQEGDFVYQGRTITQQATSYDGGNAAAVGLEIATKNLELAESSLKNTVDIVTKNREIADTNRDNTERLRTISDQSIGETKDVLSLLNAQISELESQIASAPDQATKLALEASLIPLQSSANQTQQALRSLEYQVTQDNPPTSLADMSRDLVYRSTDLQLKSAEISRDIAALNQKSAKISASLSRVTAPIPATVEKVYVEIGQYVTPGTPVAKITGQPKLTVQANISGNVATKIDDSQPLTMLLDGETYDFTIDHVSNSPVSGSLFEVMSALPDWFVTKVYENQVVEITLPLISTPSDESLWLPIDTVFVTNTSRFVFTYEDGMARKRIIETGEIAGSSIEVTSGLVQTDIVITDRSVHENEHVEIEG